MPPVRMRGPAIAARGDGHRQAIVQRAGEQTEVLDVVLLVLLKEVVGGDAEDGRNFRPVSQRTSVIG